MNGGRAVHGLQKSDSLHGNSWAAYLVHKYIYKENVRGESVTMFDWTSVCFLEGAMAKFPVQQDNQYKQPNLSTTPF